MNLTKLIQLPFYSTSNHEEEVKATWTELFFDLVFVVAIISVGTELGRDISLLGFLKFFALLVPIWWAWMGHTNYTDRFGTDDVLHRFVTYLQMITVSLMAIFVIGGFDNNFTPFVLSYIATRLLVVLSFAYAGYFVKGARPLTNRYLIGFTLALVPRFIAIFIPNTEIRLALMFLGIAIDLATPLFALNYQKLLPVRTSHLKERHGLFFIIVLGECFLTIIPKAQDKDFSLQVFSVLIATITLTFSIWWLYFQNVDTSKLKIGYLFTITWSYTHLIMIAGLILLAKSLGEILAVKEVTEASIGVFFNFSILLILISFALIDFTTTFNGERKFMEQINNLIKLFAGIIVFIMLLFSQEINIFLNLVITICIVISLLFIDTFLKRRQMQDSL